ncbi:hypothetical protein OG453_07225 [Streptomyces sp. NBC_01381]|uniref:hypothetical protein n=1 Tax=Streptomyces sp. NBC_01381 TaxID=2903845 RepID=UPI00225A8310|nr:hypothetical protein [Streptomyces sp. NBC_01381]MCX4666459.1 hypothetical protein [Streptomyces sp. NBC_01381]
MDMRKGTDAAGGVWGLAVQRATVLTERSQPGGLDENCWDDVAIRDIIAVVLYALHLRHGHPVERVKWESVLWHLRDDQTVRTLVEDVLPAAGHRLAPEQSADSAVDDPVVERWRWLTRTWDPQAPPLSRTMAAVSPWYGPPTPGPVSAVPEPLWGGMSRGIGNGLPDPAVEVCTSWAAHAVQQTLSADCSGYAIHQRVRIIDGPYSGQCGYVRELGWVFDDGAQEVVGPAGYVVDLDDAAGTERFDADEVSSRADGLHWADRAEGTIKYEDPRAGWRGPALRALSCAEDLAAVLERVSNPEIVPTSLRDIIAAAYGHHHLNMGSGAAAKPNRVSWQLSMHWYQLTSQFTNGQVAELWEVEFKAHLHDPSPVRYAALNELEARALVSQRTEPL